MHPRVIIGLRYVATNLRPDRAELYRDMAPGGDMLLTAMKSTGMAVETPDEGIQLTDKGASYLRDVDGDNGFDVI